MKIINTLKINEYKSRPGDGSVYSHIDHVELSENNIKMLILAPEAQLELPIEVEITSPEIIKILPSLLGGEISCYDAFQQLESHLRDVYKDKLAEYSPTSYSGRNLRSSDMKMRMVALCNMLLEHEGFAKLSLWFPHERENRFKWMQDTPIKVVSDEIIDGINNLCIRRRTYLQK